ncbi:hypothetical protein ACFYXS_02315 [Streptomyces sp. NPDC002574]|uniref:hypothetical protein n=1 Tax=Streptomyces sp. NPDC002574 TaxID=3364652 RepID=UPI00367A2751
MGEGHRRRRWATSGIVGAAVLAGALWYTQQEAPAAPRVDPALERAVLPVVDRYLLTDSLGPLGGDDPPEENGVAPRGFCTEHIVEIRPTGAGLRVGLAAWCGHFARHGSGGVSMLDGGIMAGVLTVSPATAPARVSDVSWEPDGDSSAWAAARFSPGGAAEAERLTGDAAANLTDPETKARAAFGLPASAAPR